MMPFMTQPAVAPACYVPNGGSATSANIGAGKYLYRDFSTGSGKVFTVSAWLSLSDMSPSLRCVLDAWVQNNNNDCLLIQTSHRPAFRFDHAYTWAGAEFGGCVRDSAFAHFIWRFDSRSGGSAAPLMFALNGLQEEAVGTVYNPVSTENSYMTGPYRHTIGRWNDGNYPFNGLISDFILVDGQTLAPDVFGEFNIHGVWVPKPKDDIHAAIAAKGGFGVNGCHLDFSDPLNPGKDVSGKGNHWTAEGFDVSGKDSVASTPTNVYATLCPLAAVGPAILTDGNLINVNATGAWSTVAVDLLIPPSGKYSFQATKDGAAWGRGSTHMYANIGLVSSERLLQSVVSTTDAVAIQDCGWGGNFGATVDLGSAIADGDVITVDVDRDGGTFAFKKNGAPYFSGALPAAWVGRPIRIINDTTFLTVRRTFRFDFGQRGYTPPTGYKTLCTDNLPEPDIKDPSEAFAQVVATGADLDGALTALTGHWNGAPYVEIVKRREASEDWRVRFSDDPGNAWATNNALAKAAAPALAATGNYVGYRLRVGARYGVWTAEVPHTTGTATTVTHSLNTAGNMVIATRVSTGGGSRYLRHPDMDTGKLMVMGGATPGCVSDASLSDFSADSFRIAASAPSGTYRVLVLAERSGLLALTTHTGSGNADGTFVPTDVLPHLAMIVETTASGGVKIWDAARAPSNPVTLSSALASSAVESGSDAVDFVVGGVKLRSTGSTLNGSGAKYVGLVWGRPVGGVCVAPATAR